jgi:hypothetical protein
MNMARWYRRVAVGAALVSLATVSVFAATGSTATTARTDSWGKDMVVASHSSLDVQLALARAATAKYVGNLTLAKANGYQIITRMIPNMGFHYMNPSVKGFDVENPPILVYDHVGSGWQLGALEWVFTSVPNTPPLPGARYGAFGAGCHYKDGTFYPSSSQQMCPARAPGTGAAFSFWHPNLVTLHVWLWDPNPDGLYASTNPRVAPFGM